MAIMDKIGTLMQRPGEDVVSKDEVPWWMKYAGRGVGTVGSGIAILLGLWNCIMLIFGNIPCFLGGIWQMVSGFAVIVIEAPCCCLFIDFVQTLSEWVDGRPYWNRAAFYIVIAIPAVILCPGLGSIFGSGLIFLTGVIYGMMALGKKASAEEMQATAAQLSAPNPGRTSQKSNLVENAEPISITVVSPPK